MSEELQSNHSDNDSTKDKQSLSVLAYTDRNMDELYSALKKLTKTDEVHLIKEEVEELYRLFMSEYDGFLKEKKEEYLLSGGQEYSFSYRLPIEEEFRAVYRLYKGRLRKHYKDFEKTLNENYKKKLHLVEQFKELINLEENINTTFKHFVELQQQWREIGHVPRIHMDDLWRNYHHHVEKFYDFLNLNRELRDKDFARNLEEKRKLIARAEELVQEANLQKALKEMRMIQKIWREDIGPVSKEYREDIWQQFQATLEILRQRKKVHLQQIEAVYEQNLIVKNDILNQMEQLIEQPHHSMSEWYKKNKKMSVLRGLFLEAGKVTAKDTKANWTRFRVLTKTFNLLRNTVNRQEKETLQSNLDKRRKLIDVAVSNQDSSDWETTTAIMMQIQKDWKEIGRVSHKFSDKTWKEFRAACDYYFQRMYDNRDKQLVEERQHILDSKQQLLERVKEYKQAEEAQTNIDFVKGIIREWSATGKAISTKEKEFSKIFEDALQLLIKEFDITQEERALFIYELKMVRLYAKDSRIFQKEREAINKKIITVTAEMRQLENNASFINAKPDSPLLVDIHKRITQFGNELDQLNIKKNQLNSLHRQFEKQKITE